MNRYMTWSEIVSRYRFDEVVETYHHDGSTKGRPEQHELFHCQKEPGGSEFEVTNFLNSLVKLFKFKNILETGAEQGHSTVAMAEAVAYNGVGKLTSVDNCEIAADKVPKRLSATSLSPYVNYIKKESVQFAKEYGGPPFDFVFFDCGFPSRIDAFHILMEKGKLSRIVSFHDASYYRRDDPQTANYLDSLDEIHEKYALRFGGLFNIISRGFRMFQLAL